MTAVISLRLGKKVDTHVGEQNKNESPSLSSSLHSPQGYDVLPSPVDLTPSKEVNDLKESESINDSTSPRDASTPSPWDSKPPPSFLTD